MQRNNGLLHDLKHAARGNILLFSDEKIFDIVASSNHWNDRLIGNDPNICLML